MITQNLRCLACSSEHVDLALDLGNSPLANSYKNSAEQQDARYPLAVNLCHACFHLQLSHTVDPAIIYKDYMYATGTNTTIQQYCEWFANFVKEYIKSFNATGQTVLDIGCNDGTQLDHFANLNYSTYGIDPAQNLHWRIAKQHRSVCDFFGPAAVDKLKDLSVSRRYDVIVAQNVFAHNPNPLEFLLAAKELMNFPSYLFIQTSQADMVLHNEFDTIYHEHINFFNANSMNELAKRAGMHLVDVIKTPIHGNSYIFVLRLSPHNSYHVQNIIAMEHAAGLYNVDTYTQWQLNIQNNIHKLVDVVKAFREDDTQIVGYGAAAKGMTLLNFSGLELDFIVDDNPLKQGKYAPGTEIPICNSSEILEVPHDKNILFIPLAWNFYTEIRQRIQSVRSNPNDRFLSYFPTVEVRK